MIRAISVLGLAAAAVLSLPVSAAHATLFIGLQQDAGPIITVVSGATPAVPATFVGSFGNFEGVSVSGLGQPGAVLPIVLQSSSLAVNNAGPADAGTLTIYLTSTDNTAPLGTLAFTSGFATVDLTAAWTETLESYLDPGNGVYSLTTQLGSALFGAVDHDTDLAAGDTGAGPYSVTAVYRITAPSLSSSSSTIGIAAAVVPEPASLALLGFGLAGLGVTALRSRTST